MVWASAAKLSSRILGAGALLVLVWMIAFAIQTFLIFKEHGSGSITPENGLGYWWVLAAIGAPLAVLGLCLHFTALRELRRLSRQK
jgi:hypothetical protein